MEWAPKECKCPPRRLARRWLEVFAVHFNHLRLRIETVLGIRSGHRIRHHGERLHQKEVNGSCAEALFTSDMPKCLSNLL